MCPLAHVQEEARGKGKGAVVAVWRTDRAAARVLARFLVLVQGRRRARGAGPVLRRGGQGRRRPARPAARGGSGRPVRPAAVRGRVLTPGGNVPGGRLGSAGLAGAEGGWRAAVRAGRPQHGGGG